MTDLNKILDKAKELEAKMKERKIKKQRWLKMQKIQFYTKMF